MGKKHEQEEVKKVKKTKDKNKVSKNKVEKNEDNGGLFEKVSEGVKIGMQVLETVVPIVKKVVDKFFVKPALQESSNATPETINEIASNTDAKDALTGMIAKILPVLLTPFTSNASPAQEGTAASQDSKGKMSLDLSEILTKYDPKDLTNIATTIIGLLGKNLAKDDSLPSVDPSAKVKFKALDEGMIMKAKSPAKLVEETDASTRDISLTESSQIDVPGEEVQIEAALAGAVEELHVEDGHA